MTESEGERSRWARWGLRLAALLAVVATLAAIAVMVVHSPPVRRYALERAITALEETARIRLHAATLSYNLFDLRMTLDDVRVAAVSHPNDPFFVAERVDVALEGGLLARARRAFTLREADRIDITRGRVQIARSNDGRMNLPEGSGSDTEPEPLQLGTITAPGLGLHFTDSAASTELSLPSTDITIRRESGRIELREAGQLVRGDTSTNIRELRGTLGFDGQTLSLEALHARLDEAALTVNGRIGLLTEKPDADLHVKGRGDIARIARWGDIADGPGGEVQIDAVVRGPLDGLGADAQAHIATLRWREVTASNVAASVRVTANTFDVRQLDAQVFGGRIRAAATVPFEGGDTRTNVSWADLDVEALLRTFARGLAPRATGRATGSLAAHGPIADPDRWTVEMRMRTAGGVTARNRVALTGTVTLAAQDGRWRLRADELAGAIPVQATLQGVVDANRLERSTVAGTITVPEVAVGALANLIDETGLAQLEMPDVEGTVHTDITVSGSLGAPAVLATGTARISDVGPLAPGTPLAGAAALEFEATAREARLRGVLHDFNATGEGVVNLSPPYEGTFEIVARSVDIARALRGIETPVPIAGTVSAAARVAGSADEWRRGRATVDVTAIEATAGSLPVRLAAPARFQYADEVVSVLSLDLLAGETRLSASGDLPVSASVPTTSAMQVTATGDLAQFASAVAATGLVEVPDVSGTGPAALLARITGSLERPHVSADLELGPGTLRAADLPAATDVHLRAHSDGEWIDLRELRAIWQGSRIDATARVPVTLIGEPRPEDVQPLDADATLDARMTGVTPEVLAPFVDPETLTHIAGSVDASFHAQAKKLDLASATGFLQLDRMDVRVADLPITQRVPTRITLESGFARVAAWEWAGQGGSLGITGRVNLTNQQAALLATGRFDLRMLTPFVRDTGLTVAGMAEPRLSITGVLPDVRVDGDVSIGSGELRLTNPRIVATDLSARAVVSRDVVQLTSVAGSLNGGRLSGRGRVAFAPRTPLEATLSLSVDGMGLDFPEGLRSELNAALGITLLVPAADVAQPTGSVSGTVTVVRSAYREPMAVVGELLGRLRTRQLAGTVSPEEPSAIDNLALDIRVLTDDDIFVDNNLGRLQLGTDLRLIGTVAAPSIAGRAQVREGGRLYFGRNIYVIDSGTIDFANAVTIEPDLNIRARTRAGGENIDLTLRGTPSNLETELAAPDRPELGEADLYSLLITGKTLAEVSGDEAEVLGEQLLQYVSGDVLGLASRAVGVDTIRLGGVEEDVLRRDPTALATEVDPTTRLTFGKSFGRDVDVTYSQSLRDGDAQAWIVDYRPWPSVEARFVSDDESLRSYELRHDVSIGGSGLSSTAGGVRPTARRAEVRVSDVTVHGTGPIPEARVLSALEVTGGDVFDFADWQRDRERLEALYQAADYYEARIDARRIETPTGTALVYEITPGARTRIEVTGFQLDEGTVNRIRTAWAQAVVDEFLREEVRSIVAADLARAGYLQAQVTVTLRFTPEADKTKDAPEKTLVVAIEPGPPVRAYAVRIETADPALAHELEQFIRDRQLERVAASEPARVEREVTAHLRAAGYLQVRVSSGAPSLEGGHATVSVQVDPGQRFTIAELTFIGASRIPTQTLLSESGLTTGATFDPAAVDSARQRIVALYRREGFAQATVEVRQAPRDAAAGVAVGFTIDEGPRQVVAEIDVQGSRAVDTDVVTRAMNLEIDQPLAADAWLQARRRVFDTGLFRRVDVAAEPVGSTAPEADIQPMRVRVNVQPWPALRLRYGFQVSEQRPEGELEGRELAPGLSADITRRTLFGRAVTLGGAVDYHRREQGARAFVSAPTMFGWPVESLVVLERTRETFTAQTLTTDRSSLSLEERFRVTPDLRLSATYRLTRDHTFDTGEPDPIVGPRDITVRVARLNTSAAFDVRDDPVDSRRGLLLSLSVDYAPAALGSEFRYAKFLTQAYYFRPRGDVVFASAARFGVAAALDDQLLLLSERFTAGGAHTVRGVEEDSLGPRDFFGPTGGEAVLILNQEVRFPMYRWLRGVVFLDGGNVFGERSDFSFSDLEGSTGVGLRLHTPFGLFRVDYGRLFTSSPAATGSGRWTFGLGQAF